MIVCLYINKTLHGLKFLACFHFAICVGETKNLAMSISFSNIMQPFIEVNYPKEYGLKVPMVISVSTMNLLCDSFLTIVN